MNARSTSRRQPCGLTEASVRLGQAKAYLRVAELAATGSAGDAWPAVCAGSAVLAGIAAADAITCQRIGRRHRGQNHTGATTVLREALGLPESRHLENALQRLLALKDEAHYGLRTVSESDARLATRWARTLVDWAVENL